MGARAMIFNRRLKSAHEKAVRAEKRQGTAEIIRLLPLAAHEEQRQRAGAGVRADDQIERLDDDLAHAELAADALGQLLSALGAVGVI